MSHVLRLPAGTSEYLQARVRVDRDETDPTGFGVETAVVDKDVMPGGGDWTSASWAAGGPPFYVRRLHTGVAGTWRMWVRITTGTETVVRAVGLVEFYVES